MGVAVFGNPHAFDSALPGTLSSSLFEEQRFSYVLDQRRGQVKYSEIFPRHSPKPRPTQHGKGLLETYPNTEERKCLILAPFSLLVSQKG